MLEFYAEWSAGLSDEMYVGPTMATTPDGVRVIMMDVVYNGDPAQGEKELAPLRKIGYADGRRRCRRRTTPSCRRNKMPLLRHGVRSYAKNGMVKEWTQGLVDIMLEADDPRIFIAQPRCAEEP